MPCPPSQYVLLNSDFVDAGLKPRASTYPIKPLFTTLKARSSTLTAPTRTAAAHAAVAASVAGHDGAADGATGSVAHVDQLFQRVGGVVVSGDRSAHRELSVVGCRLSVTFGLPSARSPNIC